MFKIGDKVRMTETYHKVLLKHPDISEKYKTTREIGIITRINKGKCVIDGEGSWSEEYLELSKDREDNEI